MLEIWGRPYSSNVIPVIWTANELGLDYTLQLAGAEAEIVHLHRFFEAWMNGILPESDEGFARFTNVMDESFEIISPREGAAVSIQLTWP